MNDNAAIRSSVFSAIAAGRIVLGIFLFLGPAAAPAQTPLAASNTSLFTGKDASAVINDALVKAGAGENLEVSINGVRDEDIIVQASGFVTADADGLSFDKAHSRWQVTLLPTADGKTLAPFQLSGRFEETTSIPVLKRRLQEGEVITQDDIDWSKQPFDRLRKNTVTDTHDLIGKTPKHVISPERAIRSDEVVNPPIINKGQRVTMVFKSGNIEIETFGEAMEPGAKGDVIHVRNIASKAIIEGTVESSDSVRVSAPNSSSAEAM